MYIFAIIIKLFFVTEIIYAFCFFKQIYEDFLVWEFI